MVRLHFDTASPCMIVRGITTNGLSSRSDTRLKAVFQLFAVQIAADEDEAAFTLFAVFPRALVIAFDDHMNALNDVTFGVVLEGDNALEA